MYPAFQFHNGSAVVVEPLDTQCRWWHGKLRYGQSHGGAVARGGILLALAFSLLGVSGCNSLEHRRMPAMASMPTSPTHEAQATLAGSPPTLPSRTLGDGRSSGPSPRAEAKGTAEVVPASHTSPGGSLAGQAPCVGWGSHYGESFGAAGGDGCPSCGPSTSGVHGGGYPRGPTARNRQEYIFDGGDQRLPVIVREDWSAAGVDPTDTVAYYETEGGKVCVQATNRVPIYAPRFGAVRKVTGLEMSARAVGTERMLTELAASGLEEADPTGTVSQPLAALGQQQIGRLDAFRERRQGLPMDQVTPTLGMSDALVVMQTIDFFHSGEMNEMQMPALGRVLANARSWYTPESVEVMIDGQDAGLVIDTKRAQDVHVYEIPDRCALRICKAASHSLAEPGDIVRFTIRFDNVGVKPIRNTVIMDSLSARLEYIEGSERCSLEAIFLAEPNEVGSQTLRWELEAPLPKSSGGVISFDCLVR
jgi:uncharacterized repeat protein (TIGR01451 family)